MRSSDGSMTDSGQRRSSAASTARNSANPATVEVSGTTSGVSEPRIASSTCETSASSGAGRSPSPSGPVTSAARSQRGQPAVDPLDLDQCRGAARPDALHHIGWRLLNELRVGQLPVGLLQLLARGDQVTTEP